MNPTHGVPYWRHRGGRQRCGRKWRRRVRHRARGPCWWRRIFRRRDNRRGTQGTRG